MSGELQTTPERPVRTVAFECKPRKENAMSIDKARAVQVYGYAFLAHKQAGLTKP